MRISELFEQYDSKYHVLATLLATNPEACIGSVDNTITDIQSAYTKDKNNASIYIGKLEELQEILLKSLDDDSIWDRLAKYDDPDELQAYYQDFVDIEEKVEAVINQMKNDSGIFEDITDFKAADGQLSAMSTKRPKTKKDNARSEVEQLFKENKK